TDRVRRKDSQAKSDGTARFTQDVQLPNMLTAMVAHAPRFGATVASFDATEAKKVAGVVDVFQIPTGVAVVAVVSPDSRNLTGYWSAPPHRDQRGYGRFFAQQAAWSRPAPAWWDEPDTFVDDDRFDAEPQPSRADLAERDDLGLEILLDQIEAEFDAKLWWYGDTRRRTKYPPALGSVAELFAYARKQELDLAEVARRNRERQADPWLDGQRQQDRARVRQVVPTSGQDTERVRREAHRGQSGDEDEVEPEDDDQSRPSRHRPILLAISTPVPDATGPVPAEAPRTVPAAVSRTRRRPDSRP
ncbi:MAG: hypothetical protein WCI78_18740, partial [Mycobacterium sp.]